MPSYRVTVVLTSEVIWQIGGCVSICSDTAVSIICNMLQPHLNQLLPHDFTGKGVFNVLRGVLPK